MRYDICFLGDLFIEQEFENVDGNIREILRSSKLVLANLEAPICSEELGEPANKYACLRMSPNKILPLLKNLEIGYVSLANNHVMDFGFACLEETINYLKENGISWFGAGRNIKDAKKPLIVDVNGFKVGFIGFSTVFTPDARATEQKAGIYGVRVKTTVDIDPKIAVEEPAAPYMINGIVLQEDIEELTSTMNILRNKVDVLIPYVHWGVGLYPYGEIVLDYVIRLSHDLIDRGADFIVGTHSHIVQEAAKYKDRVIFYSLGNFLFYPHMYDMSNIGMIVCYNIKEKFFDLYFLSLEYDELRLLKDLENVYEVMRFITKSRRNGVDFTKIKYGFRVST